MIHRPPQVMGLAVDLHEYLVQVPLPVRVRAHPANAAPADLGGKHRTEPVPPKPYRFMADFHAALMQ